MGISTTANNVIGAAGGGVLAACLVPQVWRLYRTKSASDISLFFLELYFSGLSLTFVYLYFEGAVVAWICMLVEMGFCFAVILAKIYLDHWGPYGSRRRRSSTGGKGSEAGTAGEACRLCGSSSRKFDVSADGSSTRGSNHSGMAAPAQLASMPTPQAATGNKADGGSSSGLVSHGGSPADTGRLVLEVHLPGLLPGAAPEAGDPESGRQAEVLQAVQAALAQRFAGVRLRAVAPNRLPGASAAGASVA